MKVINYVSSSVAPFPPWSRQLDCPRCSSTIEITGEDIDTTVGSCIRSQDAEGKITWIEMSDSTCTCIVCGRVIRLQRVPKRAFIGIRQR